MQTAWNKENFGSAPATGADPGRVSTVKLRKPYGAKEHGRSAQGHIGTTVASCACARASVIYFIFWKKIGNSSYQSLHRMTDYKSHMVGNWNGAAADSRQHSERLERNTAWHTSGQCLPAVWWAVSPVRLGLSSFGRQVLRPANEIQHSPAAHQADWS